MADFNLTPTIVTALVAQQDPTMDDTVNIDITKFVDVGNATATDDNGNTTTTDVGTASSLLTGSTITQNPLPADLQKTVDPPIKGFNTDGWVPVDYSYDANGHFVVTHPVDDGLTPDFSQTDIMTSSDF